ncbi:hypothetical protein SOVF_055300 [Spinacia oleracea]|uniref:Uncharacterized protein isoform X2 n=1 Tax=Spinacia oleracea TaxID=3562 RepID=A0A9R0J9P4_SPIOL|nr:uncharacterized protein LOC110802343 isoform X2 [Spinacia oleracea]KNA20129.1 hypothetical protein SOVF_055300 [Spinacia oleracea]
MSKFVNSFALLDDEEGDNVDILVDRLVKKVGDSLMHVKNETESSDLVRNNSGGKKGGRSGRGESRGDGDGSGWDDFQGGDDHRKNYSGDSYVSGYGIGDGKSHGRGQGHGKSFGGENGECNVNEAAGDGKTQTLDDDAGWQDVSKSHGKGYDNHNSNGNRSFDGERKGYGDQVQGNGQKRFRNGNQGFGGERRGYENQNQDNSASDGRMRYRNGNQGLGGERRGNENQGQDNDATDGRRRYRNGRQSFEGERRGYEDQVKDSNANSEQKSRKVEVNEGNQFRGEVRNYRNRNRNDGGEKRDYGGSRGKKGSLEYRRTGSGELNENDNAGDGQDVKADLVNGSGWDTEIVLEVSKSAETEVHNTSDEVTEDIRDLKVETEEQKVKNELEQKKKEEAKKEAALMTLDEYEKLLSEKKQALNSQKTEVRTVSVDKEFEGMQLIEKKPVDTEELWVSAKDKRKMKDGVKSEVDNSDTKLESEEEKLKKDGSLEKKEKGRKVVAVKVDEIFKPVSLRRNVGGGGRGRGDQGGFSDQTKNGDAPGRTSAPVRAPPQRRLRIPTDKDFPVLAANPPASVIAL